MGRIIFVFQKISDCLCPS